VKLCVALVPHRSEDVIRADPDLRGRVLTMDLGYWPRGDLEKIAALGFGKLNVTIPPDAIRRFADEAAGSPQLMQQICLHACFILSINASGPLRSFAVDDALQRKILEGTATTTGHRTLVGVLDDGPKTRGTERKFYRFKDGSRGDVYRCVLRAIAADPPHLSFKYDEILARVGAVCDGESPAGSSISVSLVHMARLAEEKHPTEHVLDWDHTNGTLDIPDP